MLLGSLSVENKTDMQTCVSGIHGQTKDQACVTVDIWVYLHGQHGTEYAAVAC